MIRMSEEITRFDLRPLGEYVEVLDRLRKPINADARRTRQGDIPYFGANGQVGTIDEWLFDEELVLVAEDGGFFDDSFRPIYYRISGKSWVNNHAHVLRPTDSIDVDWLNYSIKCQDISDLVKGATRKKLNQRELRQILIPVPPLREQRRIVARIKECMERVEEFEGLQASVANMAAHLPVALRYDIWEKCSASSDSVELGAITESTKNGLYKPKTFHGSGIALLRMFNINGATFDLGRIERVDATEKERADYAIVNNDIIISRVNSRKLVGKSALVTGLQEPAVHEAMIIRLRVDASKVNLHLLSWLLNSPQFLHDLRGRAKHAIGQSSINQKDLLASNIPMPNIEVQHDIVNYLSGFTDAATSLCNECCERYTMSKALRESILRKAFAGEL